MRGRRPAGVDRRHGRGYRTARAPARAQPQRARRARGAGRTRRTLAAVAEAARVPWRGAAYAARRRLGVVQAGCLLAAARHVEPALAPGGARDQSATGGPPRRPQERIETPGIPVVFAVVPLRDRRRDRGTRRGAGGLRADRGLG